MRSCQGTGPPPRRQSIPLRQTDGKVRTVPPEHPAGSASIRDSGVVGLLLRLLQRLEKRTEAWPTPTIPDGPVKEVWAEVLIRASCQAVWDQIQAPTGQTHVAGPDSTKEVSLAGPSPEDGAARSLTFRMTDHGQLSVLPSTLVAEEPPHESTRHITIPSVDVVDVLERHTLTEVPGGCSYRVAIVCHSGRSQHLSKSSVSMMQEALVEFAAKIRFLAEGALDRPT